MGARVNARQRLGPAQVGLLCVTSEKMVEYVPGIAAPVAQPALALWMYI